MKIRIATRRSTLALTQTRWFARQITKLHPECEIEEVHVVTKGDRVQDRPLASLGGKGLFVSEVEAMVSRGEADIAVHSLKDVPGDVELAPGMELMCLPERENPQDVLISQEGLELGDFRAGAKVGTTSLRRVAQLRVQRPDLNYENLRGNVDTRLAKLDSGEFDAIVLAAAGLIRLSLLEGRKHYVLPIEHCLPAVGQGTLAIEAKSERDDLRNILAPLEHSDTRIATEAERALLKRMEGSCRVPMAGYATIINGRLSLDGMVGSLDGTRILTAASEHYLESSDSEARIKDAVAVGLAVADSLIDQGARDLMREAEADVLRSEKTLN